MKGSSVRELAPNCPATATMGRMRDTQPVPTAHQAAAPTRGDDEAEVAAAGHHLFQDAKQHVGVERALVRLVHDHRRVPARLRQKKSAGNRSKKSAATRILACRQRQGIDGPPLLLSAHLSWSVSASRSSMPSAITTTHQHELMLPAVKPTCPGRAR